MRIRAVLALIGLSAAAAVAAPATVALAYPPNICATLSVSTTTPLVGESITVTGTHFDPNSTVRLELRPPGSTLGTAHSNAQGQFSIGVTMPANASGRHDIVAVGGNAAPGPGCPADPSQALDIQSTGGASSSGGPGPNGGGGGPAMTGVDIAGLIAAALALLGVGYLVNRGGRRRRRAYAAKH